MFIGCNTLKHCDAFIIVLVFKCLFGKHTNVYFVNTLCLPIKHLNTFINYDTVPYLNVHGV